MKLLTKTTFYYLLFSLPVFLLSGWLLYNSIQRSILEEIDEELLNNKTIWLRNVDSGPAVTGVTNLQDPYVQVERADFYSAVDIYSDTTLFQPLENEMVPFRNLATYIKRDGTIYKISFQRSILEKGDLLKNLAFLMAFVFGGLLLLFLLINLYVNKKLWKPFNSTLSHITSLSMQQLQGVHFEKVSIQEFNALNTALNAMTAKMHADYLSMKDFTQNASHEIQTPLAIIQSKLELLLQDSRLTEQQANIISSATDATQRLSKLNQSLLFITKIESNQFSARHIISMQSVVQNYVSLFAEILEQKKLVCNLVVVNDWNLNIHEILADMLVSNLLSNAIRCNTQGGKIDITLNEKGFMIGNNSDQPKIEQDMLFRRFSKEDATAGNGLGLAIVKEICDNNGLTIEYTYSENYHRFSITGNT